MKTTFTKIFVILVFVVSFGNLFGVSVTVSNINVPLDCSNYSHTGNQEVCISLIPHDDMRWEFELVQDDGNLNLTNLNYSIGPEDGFYYSVPSGWYNEGGTGYVNITFSITQANRIKGAYRDVKFRCRYLHRWSGWSSWIEREFRISVNDLNISGNYLICYSPNQTYTVSGYPASSSFNWTKKNILTNVGRSTSTSYVVHAGSTSVHDSGWVNVEVSKSNCTWEKQKKVWVGPPIITKQKVDGVTYYAGMQVCPGDRALNVTPLGGNAGTATWTVPYGITYFVGINELDFVFPYDASSVAITVRSANTCGTGPSRSFYLTKQYYGCDWWPYGMTLFPNPASDNVTVTMIENQPLVEYNDSSIASVAITDAKADEPTTYTIRIYNSQSILLSTVTRSGNIFSIPLINMRDGTYIIEVSDGENSFRQQLFVKHN